MFTVQLARGGRDGGLEVDVTEVMEEVTEAAVEVTEAAVEAVG
jgi:hypothetical protein